MAGNDHTAPGGCQERRDKGPSPDRLGVGRLTAPVAKGRRGAAILVMKSGQQKKLEYTYKPVSGGVWNVDYKSDEREMCANGAEEPDRVLTRGIQGGRSR